MTPVRWMVRTWGKINSVDAEAVHELWRERMTPGDPGARSTPAADVECCLESFNGGRGWSIGGKGSTTLVGGGVEHGDGDGVSPNGKVCLSKTASTAM
ncbi:hypothetical protein NL676_008322 [Syzygium grande]|nr:hypothetical protein NL676_008322 [Syzygium grande]